MKSSPLLLITTLVALSILRGLAFRQYVSVGSLGWLILGLAAYDVSNIAWIGLIDRAALAEATAYAAATRIVFLTLVGMLLGDPVVRWSWFAAALACLAVVAGAQARSPRADIGVAKGLHSPVALPTSHDHSSEGSQ